MTLPIGPTRQELNRLLQRYNEHPDQHVEVIAEIDRRFHRRLAVMVIDACSFSTTVRGRGVIFFLALLERLGRVVTPTIESNNGRLLRHDADNFFAAFPNVDLAARCAATICRDLRIANGPLPRPDEMHISVGIGFGDMLVIGSDDLFGDEMNLACKLGEDVADRDEILLTDRARAALSDPALELEPIAVRVAGLDLMAHKLSYHGQEHLTGLTPPSA